MGSKNDGIESHLTALVIECLVTALVIECLGIECHFAALVIVIESHLTALVIESHLTALECYYLYSRGYDPCYLLPLSCPQGSSSSSDPTLGAKTHPTLGAKTHAITPYTCYYSLP